MLAALLPPLLPPMLPPMSAPMDWLLIIGLGATELAYAIGLVRYRARHRVGADAQREVRLIIGATVVALVAMSVPWPWGPEPAARLAIAPVVIAAAAMLCNRPALSWLPILVPLIWAAGASLASRDPPASLQGALLVDLAIAAVAWATGTATHRFHRTTAREAIAARRKMLRLAAARDAAERADRDKSRFLAIASHDLRQPLHAIGLFAATLESRLHGSANQSVVVDMVQAIDGLNRSFNALMDVSQLDAGAIKPNIQRFPLRDIFRRLHMHFAGQAELAGLALRFSTGGKSVTSDPQLLERILGNLIQNALKYTVSGGVVVVVRTTASHDNIEVWDSGLGISPLELPRVFHEFYQVGRQNGVRAKGLGMGLAIVKRLARLLGHDLVVVSRLGYGSMFRLSIPHGSLSEIEDATAAADTRPMPLMGERCALIVDDDAAIRAGLELLLAEWGYRSVGASNHAEAFYALRVTESTPDLILCDLHLGEGPDGIAVIRSIRRQWGADLPAILITGDPSRDEIARTVGSDLLVLAKPVQPRTLRNALRSLEESNFVADGS